MPLTNRFPAIDYINSLEGQNLKTQQELSRQRDQMHQMELQIKELMARANSNGNMPPPPNTMPYTNGHYSNGTESEGSRTLPPIVNGSAMQGVQYDQNGR